MREDQPTVQSDSESTLSYLYPGGDWPLDTTTAGRSAGLRLDPDQRNILTAAWHPRGVPPEVRAASEEEVAGLVERGLVYIGQCPRCKHAMRSEVAFGVNVVAASIDDVKDACINLQRCWEPFFSWARSKSTSSAENLTFVCSCGQPHDHRPADTPFAGCGAVWNHVAKRDWDWLGNTDDPDDGERPDASPETSVGTAEDAARAASAKEIASNPLARIRTQAGQWRTGTTALTAALTVAAFLKGPAALGPDAALRWATAAAAGVGFVLLLVGTNLALLASLGMSGYDHRLLNSAMLRGYERERAQESINQIEWSIILVTAAIVFFGVAAFLALF